MNQLICNNPDKCNKLHLCSDSMNTFILIINTEGTVLEINKQIKDDDFFKKLSGESIYKFIPDYNENLQIQETNIKFTENDQFNITVKTQKLSELSKTETSASGFLLFIESSHICYEIKNNFMLSFGHEIRTPLNAIVTCILLLSENTKLTIEQSNYLRMLKEAADSLLNISNNQLDWFNLKSGKLKLNKVSFYLKDCIEKVQTMVFFNAEEKNITLNYKIDDNVPEFIIEDDIRLQQILINLYMNSVKFSKPKTEIFLQVSMGAIIGNKFYLELSIHDSGSAGNYIKEEEFGNIFKIYNQLFMEETKRNIYGMGLGLSICKELTLLMGGDIKVDYSNEIKGTMFKFNILTKKSYEENAPIDTDILTGKNVLIIDDTIVNRITLCDILKNYGMNVYPVSSSDEALIMIKNKSIRYDIALVDIYLPRFTGVKLAQHIKSIDSTIPMIALSSAGNNVKNIGDYLFAGIHSKPINDKKLMSLIQNTLMKNDTIGPITPNVSQIKINNIKFLIVDTEPFSRLLLVSQLKKLDYNDVIQVSGYHDFLDMIKKFAFDMVFIDNSIITSNTKNTDEFTKILKSQITFLPYIILLSGYRVTLNDSIRANILKPIELDTLKDCIDKYVQDKISYIS